MTKKKGASPDQAAPQEKTTYANSTAPLGAWLLAVVIVALLGGVAK